MLGEARAGWQSLRRIDGQDRAHFDWVVPAPAGDTVSSFSVHYYSSLKTIADTTSLEMHVHAMPTSLAPVLIGVDPTNHLIGSDRVGPELGFPNMEIAIDVWS